MGVAVLNPRDSLVPLPKLDLDRTSPNRVRQGPRRRRSPTKSPNKSPPPRPSKAFVMGEVKLLRRGEEPMGTASNSAPADRLDESDQSRSKPHPAVAPTGNRFVESDRVVGPAPEPVTQPNRATTEFGRVEITKQKEITEPVSQLVDFYAGGAFITSPPPSSLPVPAFCGRKTDSLRFVNATNDLRKLLRLE